MGMFLYYICINILIVVLGNVSNSNDIELSDNIRYYQNTLYIGEEGSLFVNKL